MSKTCEKIAVVGQPNAGKSTFFNQVTGKPSSMVGNWPGVTVSVKVVEVKIDGKNVCLVDLPGVYTLAEDMVTGPYLAKELTPSIVLIDALNLKRGLMLALEVLEFGLARVIAINKMDLALKKGLHIIKTKLERALRTEVVFMSAAHGEGIDEVIEKALYGKEKTIKIDYGDLEEYIAKLEEYIDHPKKRAIAIMILLGSKWAKQYMKEGGERVLEEVNKIYKDPALLIIKRREELVDKILRDAVVYEKTVEESKLAQKLDEIFLNPILGPAFSFLILLGMFTAVFTINTGFPLNLWIEIPTLSDLLSSFFDSLAEMAKSLGWPLGVILGEAVIPGVGAVLSFLPLILMVYLMLALLEDSGIAARIAMSFDPLLSKVGLNGYAIFPMLMSMGCNVPGVEATRLLRGKARLAAIMAVPLIPCQARLAVLLALATFLGGPLIQSLAVISIYALSIAMFLLVSYIIVKITKGEESWMIMELPPYHKPNLKVIWWSAWESAEHFLKKAGTIILAFSIIIWALTNYYEEGLRAFIATTLQPLFEALYEMGKEQAYVNALGILMGMVAKEVYLETLVLATDAKGVTEAILKLGMTPLQIYAIMVLVSLTIPCVATLAMIYQESRSVKVVAATFLYTLFLSIAMSALIYWILRILF